jgi:hypothetical protein
LEHAYLTACHGAFAVAGIQEEMHDLDEAELPDSFTKSRGYTLKIQKGIYVQRVSIRRCVPYVMAPLEEANVVRCLNIKHQYNMFLI